MDALAKNTGGLRETIAGQNALEMYMTNIAKALNAQYEVTFRRPAGAKQPEIIQFGVSRQGLRLHHSIYAPQ